MVAYRTLSTNAGKWVAEIRSEVVHLQTSYTKPGRGGTGFETKLTTLEI